LGLFGRGRLDHRAGFRRRPATQTTEEALDALIATGEAAAIDQILPDGLGVAALRQSPLDGFPVANPLGLLGPSRRSAARTLPAGPVPFLVSVAARIAARLARRWDGRGPLHAVASRRGVLYAAAAPAPAGPVPASGRSPLSPDPVWVVPARASFARAGSNWPLPGAPFAGALHAASPVL